MADSVQLSLLDGNGEDTVLEVMQMHCDGKTNTNADEIFSGYDHLYAITFSYGLNFIGHIISNFKTADIILGCAPLVKYDAMEVIAFQKESLRIIRRHKELIERVQKGEVHFYIAKGAVAHEKIYVMTDTLGYKTRVVFGSANFSARSFDGDQRENICICDNDSNAFDLYMQEFNLVRDTMCGDEIPL